MKVKHTFKLGVVVQGAKGPVKAVLSENWVVYSYYSIVNQRFEIAVLEFYDVQPRDLSIPSLLLGNQSSTLSAFSPTPIEVTTITSHSHNCLLSRTLKTESRRRA